MKWISITSENVSLNQSSLIPGIKESLTKKERELSGIPVSKEILNGWTELGFKYDWHFNKGIQWIYMAASTI